MYFFFSLFDEGSVCVCRGHLRSPSEAGGGGIFILLHETEIPLPRIYCHGRFLKQKEKWVKNAFFAAAAGEERGEIRTLALFHPPGSCSVSSVSPRFY